MSRVRPRSGGEDDADSVAHPRIASAAVRAWRRERGAAAAEEFADLFGEDIARRPSRPAGTPLPDAAPVDYRSRVHTGMRLVSRRHVDLSRSASALCPR